MKRILTILCALAIAMAGRATVLAADAAADQDSYYPISVEEYASPSVEPRISKVYRLSPTDDPALIPTGDFDRGGRHYYLMDMTRQEEVSVDTRSHIETVTLASDTSDLETILQRLDAEMELTTEDGYTGALRLDHTSVQVAADGYGVSTRRVSATRTYPDLSDADLSLIPKTITDNGTTMELESVEWSSGGDNYTATAQYTGARSSRYATGYTVTADYTGEVTRTEPSAVIYTAVFGSVEAPAESDEAPETTPTRAVSRLPLFIGGGVLAAGLAGITVVKKVKRGR